jgi:hypothetical protein
MLQTRCSDAWRSFAVSLSFAKSNATTRFHASGIHCRRSNMLVMKSETRLEKYS